MENNFENSIGKRIAELRTLKGMTQLQLAEMLNISDKAVSKWESAGGCPDIQLLPQISDIFEVSIDYLVRGTSFRQQKFFAGNPYAKLNKINDCNLIDGLNKYYLSRGWHVVSAAQETSHNDAYSLMIVIEQDK